MNSTVARGTIDTTVARAMASRLYGARRRLDGTLEIGHSLRVHDLVAPYVGQNARLAAIFHDALEDGLVSRSELETLIGNAAAAMVRTLTRSRLPRPFRDHLYCLRLTAGARRRPEVALLKLADAIDNARSSLVHLPEKRVRKLWEASFVFLPQARRLFGDHPLVLLAEREFCIQQALLRHVDRLPELWA